MSPLRTISLAVNHRTQGKLAEAAEGYDKALAIYRKAHGENHPLTLGVANNQALNWYYQGKYREAEAGFRKLLPILEKARGEQDSLVATVSGNLGLTHQAQGRHDEADPPKIVR